MSNPSRGKYIRKLRKSKKYKSKSLSKHKGGGPGAGDFFAGLVNTRGGTR